MILGLEGYIGEKEKTGKRLNVATIAIGLFVLVLTTIGETYHFRATGKARLKAWDDARLLLTKYYDHRLEKLESKDNADTESRVEKEEAPLTGQALTAKYKREYKYFKDELDPIYRELRGAKFADAEA